MAEITKTGPVDLSSIFPSGSQAESLIALSQAAGGNPPRSVDIDGVSLRADLVAVAANARFTTQIDTLKQSARNGAEAASVLDTVDALLTKISGKLDRLEELADIGARTGIEPEDGSTYTPAERSAKERAVLQEEFDDVRSEIDDIAKKTSFNGTSLLKGDPDNSSDPLQMSFKTGCEIGDNVAVSINRADNRETVLGSGERVFDEPVRRRGRGDGGRGYEDRLAGRQGCGARLPRPDRQRLRCGG